MKLTDAILEDGIYTFKMPNEKYKYKITAFDFNEWLIYVNHNENSSSLIVPNIPNDIFESEGDLKVVFFKSDFKTKYLDIINFELELL